MRCGVKGEAEFGWGMVTMRLMDWNGLFREYSGIGMKCTLKMQHGLGTICGVRGGSMG